MKGDQDKSLKLQDKTKLNDKVSQKFFHLNDLPNQFSSFFCAALSATKFSKEITRIQKKFVAAKTNPP